MTLDTGGAGNGGAISLERAQGMGGESSKLTCAGTALDSKSEKKNESAAGNEIHPPRATPLQETTFPAANARRAE